MKLTPFIMFGGLVIYALSPILFRDNIYLGLCIGTIIFSAGCGLAEVLISPVIAAIPTPNSQSLMSKLHSCYAWGVVGVVIFSSLYFYFFGYDNWQILTLILSVFPFFSIIISLLVYLNVCTGGRFYSLLLFHLSSQEVRRTDYNLLLRIS